LLNDQDAFPADAPAQPDTHPAQPDLLPATHTASPDLTEPDSGTMAVEAEPPQTLPDVIAEPPPAVQAEATPADMPPALPLFSDTGLSDPILRAIAEKGYLHPTPIQAQAIPVVLAGRDVLGVAQTGTGKTASFVLPMMDILDGSRARARMPRSLILEPTRELALQVAENFVLYGKHLKLNHALLIGGESVNDQKAALMKGVDVLIATPGRLLDLFERGGMMLTDCRVLVIDEADRMLDMGFIPDVEKIVSFLPKTRQTLFFSATMSPEIERLTKAFLTNPRMVTVSKSATVATTIVAGLTLTAEHDKREALRRLIRSEDVQNALIFCNRKRDVDVLFKSLSKHGFSVGSLHGDMPQPARFATLEKFKANEIRLLVCSDVAARGIDIGGLSHVFNFDVPHHAEDYVHRIGRTGRAGKTGTAFTMAGPDDRLAVEAIEKLTGGVIPRIVVPGLDVVEFADGDSRKRRGRGASAAGKSGAAGKAGAAGKSSAADKPGSAGKSGDARKSSEGGTSGRPARAPKPQDTDAPLHADSEAASAPAEAGAADAPPTRAPRSRSRGRDRDRPRDADHSGDTDRPERSVRADIRAEVAPRADAQPDNQAPARAARPERADRPERAESRPDTRHDRASPRPARDDTHRARDRRPDPVPEPARADLRPAREPRRYREEDLGPSVTGFGEEIPAFMLLPKRGTRAHEDAVA
jgi:superfamily II DNA/RNA helicase